MEKQSEMIAALKKHLPFWKELTDEQKDILIRQSHTVHYSKNENVHCGDCECAGILLIKRGTIRTYMLSEEGKEITLFRLKEGEVCVLSASCILQTITFDVQIDAATDCDIIRINSAAFSQIAAENIYVEAFTYKLATQRFSDVMWTMQQILFMSFDRRLALFLIDEASKSGSDTIPMTHEEIARYTGSAREVVSRMLKYFSTEGFVVLFRGGVRILDRKGLKALI